MSKKINYPTCKSFVDLVLNLKSKYPGQVVFIKASNPWGKWTTDNPIIKVRKDCPEAIKEVEEFAKVYPTYYVANEKSYYEKERSKPFEERKRFDVVVFSWRIPTYKPIDNWNENELTWTAPDGSYTVNGTEAMRKYIDEAYAEQRGEEPLFI